VFKSNKYKRWYDSIISNAKERTLDGYVEKHHIIPRCMGGSDDRNNLVELTAREHFICHWLLPKFASTTFYKKKMLNALGRFLQKTTKQERVISSRQYEIARKAVSEANSGRVYSDVSRKKISDANKGRTPWNKGVFGAQHYPESAKEKLSNLYLNKTFEDRFGDDLANKIKQRITESKLGQPSGMLGKTHSEATKQLMRQKATGRRYAQQRHAVCPACGTESVTGRHIKYCKLRNNTV